MSCDYIKYIKHDKKNNRYFVTSASNNVWPRSYSTWEYMRNDKYSNEEIENKDLYFFHNILGHVLNLEYCQNKDWKYATNKFFNYCKENDINTYELWNLPGGEDNYDITKLKPYYEIFKGYLEEKKEGKYFLDSNSGYVVKVNKKSFIINRDKDCLKDIVGDYKKIYNDYCKISSIMREKYDIQIKEFILELDKEEDRNISNEVAVSEF